jgi:hypothetical protein
MAGPQLRVYLRERCILNPEPVPMAGAAAIPFLGLFVPKLIELAIGGVATLLRKAGKDETVSVGGRECADLYVADGNQVLRPNPKLGCIIGIAGTFDEPKADAAPSDDPVVRRLEAEGLVPIGAKIDVIVEAAIKPTRDQTAFFLDTRHFSVRDFIGERGKSERAFVMTLSVTAPGATADGDAIAIGTIDLGRLKRNADLVLPGAAPGAYPRFRSNLMPWGQISKASRTAYDADVTAGTAAGKSYMPVTFELTVSETADGNALLLALGELLDGAKKEAAAEASKLVLPDERARAEADRDAAAEELYEAELSAEVAVRKAQRAYAAGSGADKPVLRAELEAARRKWQRQIALREAAGLPARDPVPES